MATIGTATSQNSKCHLLELPAELRNRIYRYSLLEDRQSGIDIYPQTFAQPPLIRTCNQIRAEASSIYYSENTFYVDAPDFDHRLLAAFYTQIQYVLKHGVYIGARIHVDNRDATSWSNLVAYIKTYFDGKPLPAIDCGPQCATNSCGAAHHIFKVAKLKVVEGSCSWEELKSTMEIMKDMAEEQADGRWKWT
ncbi:hypothetical protein CLAFUW4_09170 [Fulvia fulva]|uniref:Uncharacterized protein n=1 Tax=Passalora fulva TaxID=5499 RepID=A0A9Q8UT78_PASFU|nr:uncharacterized protein CLAFUR5_09270 [Fulvia fulva]KAK4613692.1 hypothetical protein CLAFUR4_09176 [Fulvia fulva]KAK4614593.1 hypothetical protein CLAFUR0_09168 [Fulvia fulva]UJO21624.1 hypothetical protein CLAFUR5_09270 [Fulvia fulva]WPV20609.1 hypothetical protein CLAFUW4_09170 [Fulvia fulva]WPV34739.1 hypothetical protein CLAFUW7_09171 [Fulvia fulva]